MDKDRIKYISIGILALAFLSTLLFGSSSLRNARRLAKQLEDQVDSLSLISDEYVTLQKQYEDLSLEFQKTRTGMVQIRENLLTITQQNLQSTTVIRSRLNGILTQYDSLHFTEIDTTGVGGLIF